MSYMLTEPETQTIQGPINNQNLHRKLSETLPDFIYLWFLTGIITKSESVS